MFRYDQARQVLTVGAGTIATVPDELTALSARSVCLVGSPRSLASAAGQATREALRGFDVRHEFGKIAPHAPITDTEAMARQLRDDPPDALVAVGGGSVSDTAKALSILLAEGFPLEAKCSTFTPPDVLKHVQLDQPKIPVLTIPTTLSGAEVTPGGGATDARGIKRVFWDQKVASRVVVYDPELFTDVPAELLLTTGMNGLAHCAEALYSKSASPFTDALAAEGARRFAETLPRIGGATGPLPVDLLEDALTAAAIGGLVISNARVGLHHAVCHVLGAAYGVPHGVANSVMLPYVLEYNHDHTEAKQAILARALGEGLGETGRAAVLAATVQRRAGVPRTLADTGLAESDLARVAEEVMQDRGLFFNPKRVPDAGAVLGVLRRAWTGTVTGAA
ncbi:iron-containing alcohol dehydrogenase family protein [Amycolatopsis sp. CA-161197]|uniref:iron-containing alcohol dehydrogenase family protein n=1 Tax=unclassified Amycolatopsis TaxID=2618356 RepID=UPI003687F56E